MMLSTDQSDEEQLERLRISLTEKLSLMQYLNKSLLQLTEEGEIDEELQRRASRQLKFVSKDPEGAVTANIFYEASSIWARRTLLSLHCL